MTSGKYPGDSLLTIQTEWSMKDLLDAHEVLDLLEDAADRESERHRAELQRIRGARR